MTERKVIIIIRCCDNGEVILSLDWACNRDDYKKSDNYDQYIDDYNSYNQAIDEIKECEEPALLFNNIQEYELFLVGEGLEHIY